MTLQDSISELKILERKCRYFYGKNRIDSLIHVSEKLQKRALAYNDVYTLTMASVYLAESYSMNQYYDRAIDELEKSYENIGNSHSSKTRIFYAKANLLNSFANVYSDMGEPEKAVSKLQQVIESCKELKDKKEINRFQYLNYSNMASLYINYNKDSAQFYALRSIDINPYSENDISMMTNYSVLGKVHKIKKNYDEALRYFRKAIKISKLNGTDMNTDNVLNDMIDIFKFKKLKDSVIYYENTIKQLEINSLKSKYNSLKEVINKDKQESIKSQNNNKWLYLTSIILIIAVGIVVMIFRNKKNVSTVVPASSLSSLIKLVEEKDASFMLTFVKVFPDFTQNLLKQNPSLSQSEIEFCALLKMNLSTKEIARLTFIEPRTVQNKKNRIRKRLEIPSNSNIYHYFDKI
ncbi:tetratricopeptide (TPR) repeat protein [Epilithonimonas hungarica]|uniref:tetratricopeptide repeat protein n=1 Tax=Epilithonimonas hungarica TaxID=454006 RepID=UPI002781B66F|nr:tetratricopeptide repeat protein [Epilithonimonas hungarica]MDP9956051.1 tetratricopeptide (TPR) repeat protein [Epilithonimonas hungarica]